MPRPPAKIALTKQGPLRNQPSPKVLRQQWWAQVKALPAANPAELAPLLDDEPLELDGRVQLHPYWLRRDATALIGWAEQLEEFPKSAQLTTGDRAEGGLTTISVIGVLDGEVVELLTSTHRQIPAGAGEVAWDVLLELVDAERRDLEPVLDDIVLADWDRADPLFTGVIR